MTHTEIVKKLVGNIQSIGETRTDEERLENLKAMCEVVNNLVTEIDRVAYENRNSHKYSVKQMADFANNFLTNIIGVEK